MTVTRRRFIGYGAGAIAAALGGGYELIERGVLPGKVRLDQLLGACDVAGPQLTFATPGPAVSGEFFSQARNRTVGYTIAYPPGHQPGDRLPLAISLHGYGGNHTSGLGGITLTRALGARAGGRPLPAFALIAVDGGGLYWNPHPGDDPLAMLADEVIPMCRQRRLGAGRVGVVGISMGGYGALLLAERHPRLIAAVAAMAPAVWITYAQARSVNAGAFASADDFTRDDVITHADALAGIPVRIVSGDDDPFHAGVLALARVLPPSATVQFTPGCHDDSFFASQQHQSLAFLGEHLSAD